jgi:hypothetical protein
MRQLLTGIVVVVVCTLSGCGSLGAACGNLCVTCCLSAANGGGPTRVDDAPQPELAAPSLVANQLADHVAY